MRTSIKKKSQKLQTIAIKEKNYFIIDKYLYHPDDVIGEGAFGKVYRGLSMYISHLYQARPRKGPRVRHQKDGTPGEHGLDE